MVDDRTSMASSRSVSATARRLRLHGGVSNCPGLARRPRAANLRRYQRNHERNCGKVPRTLKTAPHHAWTSTKYSRAGTIGKEVCGMTWPQDSSESRYPGTIRREISVESSVVGDH